MIPDRVKDCVVDEHYNLVNGDSLQETTGGLLVWRKIDNFTAFTDGYRTWVNGPYGLQTRLNTESFPWESTSGAPRPSAPTGASRTPSGREVLTEYLFPVIAPPLDGTRFTCLKTNPSCARD